MTTATITDLAREAYDCFETRTRSNGDVYISLKDERPAWVYNLVYMAHDDMLPDDWRYRVIHNALEWIAEGNDPENAHDFTDSEVDIYTSDRFSWLASNINRQGYCDEAVSHFGYDEEGDIVGLIGMGQYMEAREIFDSVLRSLEAVAEED